jgi:hypothetical protein
MPPNLTGRFERAARHALSIFPRRTLAKKMTECIRKRSVHWLSTLIRHLSSTCKFEMKNPLFVCRPRFPSCFLQNQGQARTKLIPRSQRRALKSGAKKQRAEASGACEFPAPRLRMWAARTGPVSRAEADPILRSRWKEVSFWSAGGKWREGPLQRLYLDMYLYKVI